MELSRPKAKSLFHGSHIGAGAQGPNQISAAFPCHKQSAESEVELTKNNWHPYGMATARQRISSMPLCLPFQWILRSAVVLSFCSLNLASCFICLFMYVFILGHLVWKFQRLFDSLDDGNHFPREFALAAVRQISHLPKFNLDLNPNSSPYEDFSQLCLSNLLHTCEKVSATTITSCEGLICTTPICYLFASTPLH